MQAEMLGGPRVHFKGSPKEKGEMEDWGKNMNSHRNLNLSVKLDST